MSPVKADVLNLCAQDVSTVCTVILFYLVRIQHEPIENYARAYTENCPCLARACIAFAVGAPTLTAPPIHSASAVRQLRWCFCRTCAISHPAPVIVSMRCCMTTRANLTSN
jgi:hypothetical protein